MTNIQPLPPFFEWPYTLVIPKFYWDAESLEQRTKYLCQLFDKLANYASQIAENDNGAVELVNELQAEFEKFKESGFDDYYAEQIAQWVADNMPEIIGEAIKNVWFGLTDTGYFCAYVPDSWSDIMFDTGAVYGTETYGRLILRYNVNGEGVIDNTVYDEATQNLVNRVSRLEQQMTVNNGTLYTPINPNGTLRMVKRAPRVSDPLA